MPKPLEGKTFGFYAIGGQPTLAGATPTLGFGVDGVVSGFDGGNTFTGAYTVLPAGTSQGTLTILPDPGMTGACAQDVMTQAQAFMTALGQETAYSHPSGGVLLALLDITATGFSAGSFSDPSPPALEKCRQPRGWRHGFP